MGGITGCRRPGRAIRSPDAPTMKKQLLYFLLYNQRIDVDCHDPVKGSRQRLAVCVKCMSID
jgi:hypothetical protein